MEGKKGETVLFLSMKVKMFGWAECQRAGRPRCSSRVLVGHEAEVS